MYDVNTQQFLGDMTYEELAFDGGGFTFRPRYAQDGTMVATPDTNCAVLKLPGQKAWRPMLRIGETVTDSDIPLFYYPGTYDADISYLNSNIIAFWCVGQLWRSINKGTNSSIVTAIPNDVGRDPNSATWFRGVSGHRMAFDPADSTGGTFVYGDPVGGVKYSTNFAGVGQPTFTNISGIPAPSGAYANIGYFIAFDRSSTVINGRTQIVYIRTAGGATYRSTTGITGPFTTIADSPVDLWDMKVGADGTLWVTGGKTGEVDTGPVRKWSGGTWTTLDTGSSTFTTVAPHPVTAGRVIFLDKAGHLAGTVNGLTVDRYDDSGVGPLRVSPDVTWLATGNTNEDYMSQGGASWSPDGTVLTIGEGLGPWDTTNPLPNTGGNGRQVWTANLLGIKQMIFMDGLFASDRFHGAVQDRSSVSWDKDKLTKQPFKSGPDPGGGLSMGGSHDYAPEDENFIVHVTNMATPAPGRISVSQDGGRTWSGSGLTLPEAFAFGGTIAVSSKTNWIWYPTNNKQPYFTKDGGATWAAVSLGGYSLEGTIGHRAYYHATKLVIADKNVPGTFLLYVLGDPNNGSLAVKGVWKTTNGGTSWTRIRSSYFNNFGVDSFNSNFIQVIDQPGHFFWTSGGSDNPITFGKTWFTPDTGATWREVTGLYQSLRVAITAKWRPDQTYPTLIARASRGVEGATVFGNYRCHDFNPTTGVGTWVLDSKSPLGRFSGVNTVAGDRRSTKHVLGYGGTGGVIGQYRYRQPVS